VAPDGSAVYFTIQGAYRPHPFGGLPNPGGKPEYVEWTRHRERGLMVHRGRRIAC